MQIRDATEADVPAIAQILNAAIENTTADWETLPQSLVERRVWLSSRRRAGHPVIVADDGADGIVGWASYGPFRNRSGFALTVEHSVYVAERARSGGVGGALLDELIARATAAGMHVIVGGLDADNTASLRFHARHGFITVGRMPEVGHKFGRWLDLVLVQRVLQAGDPSGPPRPSVSTESPPKTA